MEGISIGNEKMGAFITFPKSRNTFQYPLSKRVCKRLSKRLSRVVAFIIELSRVRVARKALSLRSCIAQLTRTRLYIGRIGSEI